MLKTNSTPSRMTGNVVPLISTRGTGYRVALLATVVALVSLLVASGSSLTLSGSEIASGPAEAEDSDPRTEFVYFPSQYVNQAKESAEHIPTF